MKAVQKILIEENLPPSPDAEELHDTVVRLVTYFWEKMCVPSDTLLKGFVLFIHPTLMGYVLTVNKRNLIRQSYADIWKKSFNIETVAVRSVPEHKLILMEGY